MSDQINHDTNVSLPSWAAPGQVPNNLDAVRLFLALLVVFSHGWPLLQGGDGETKWEPLMWLTGGQFTLGRVAVNCFFAISGMLITRSWMESRSPADFFYRRARRIYPAYIGALVVCWFLFGPLAANHLHSYALGLHETAFLRQAVLLQMISVPDVLANQPLNTDINGSSWSIAYEAACYLLVAVLGICGGLNRFRWVVPLLLTAAGAWYWQQQFGPLPILRGDPFWLGIVPVPWLGEWPRLLTCFLAGAAFYQFRDRLPRKPLLLVAALLGLAEASRQRELVTWLPFLGTYALFYTAFAPRPRWLGVAAFRNDYSYGIYLYAWPIQRLLVLHFHNHLTPWTLFLSSLPPTFVCAWLSWHLIEKRWLRREATRAMPETMPARATGPAEPVFRLWLPGDRSLFKVAGLQRSGSSRRPGR